MKNQTLKRIDERKPSESFLFKSSIAKLIWKYFEKGMVAKKSIAYYKSLYAEDNNGWKEAKRP